MLIYLKFQNNNLVIHSIKWPCQRIQTKERTQKAICIYIVSSIIDLYSILFLSDINSYANVRLFISKERCISEYFYWRLIQKKTYLLETKYKFKFSSGDIFALATVDLTEYKAFDCLCICNNSYILFYANVAHLLAVLRHTGKLAS